MDAAGAGAGAGGRELVAPAPSPYVARARAERRGRRGRRARAAAVRSGAFRPPRRPAWEGRDRAVDVMARVERALATGGRDAADGRGELPSPAQLLGKLRGERALKRLHVLFGGDALSA